MIIEPRSRTIYRRLGALGAGLAAAVVTLWAQVAAAQNIPLIKDDEIESLLSDYARPIIKAAGIPSGSVAMRIVNDKSFNAFVLDGNNVYIHMGAIMQAETPNQIIGVIAHEVGHIDGAHVAAMRSRMAREATRMLLLRLLGIGAAVLSRSGEAIVAADEIVVRGFLAERRSQEAAADQAGMKYLNATKQSGLGMLQTFERLGAQNRVATGPNPYLLSHPTETTRIAQLRQAVESSPFFGVKDAPELQERHNLVRGKLYGFTTLPQDVERIFPASNTTLPARYARAIAHNCSGNCSRAIGEVDALIKERPNNPFFWELKGHLLTKDAKWREAAPASRKALQLLANKSSLIKIELARSLIEMNEPAQIDEAISLLEVALEIQKEDAEGFRLLARAYAAKGRIPEADLATALMHQASGRREQAVTFATRARTKLQNGSRAWLKADDIIKIKPQKLE